MSARVITLLTIVRHKGEFAVVEVQMREDSVLHRSVLDTSPDWKTTWAAYLAHSKKLYLKKEQAN